MGTPYISGTPAVGLCRRRLNDALDTGIRSAVERAEVCSGRVTRARATAVGDTVTPCAESLQVPYE
jgi:hypothetical protein